jgi:hypothetical protein
MIKKQLLSLFCMVLFAVYAQAQTSINFAGGVVSNGNITLAFSAGETISGDFEGSGFSFNTGFTSVRNIISTPNEVENPDLPADYGLSQNYPNPFNPTTNIQFSLPESSDLKLDVFNSIGMRVATLVDEKRGAGRYTVSFNASALSSGMYFYRLIANGKTIETKKMLLIK